MVLTTGAAAATTERRSCDRVTTGVTVPRAGGKVFTAVPTTGGRGGDRGHGLAGGGTIGIAVLVIAARA